MSSPTGLRAIPKILTIYVAYDGETLESLSSVDSLESVWDALVESWISL